jgi:uncharacterized repeat protein (TIGR01451 family)
MFIGGTVTNTPTAQFIGSSTNNNSTGDPNADGDIDTSGKSWGLLGNGQDVFAERQLNGLMTNGQRFVISMDNGYVPPGGEVGFLLQNDLNETRLQFILTGATNVYNLESIGAATGITNTDQGLKIEVEMVNIDTAKVSVTTLVDGSTHIFSNILMNAGVSNGHHQVNFVVLENKSTGGGATNRVFFNSVYILPDTNDASFFADQALGVATSSNPALVNSNLTYTISVTNRGPATATGMTVTDVPPSGVTFVSATSAQGTCTTDAFGRVVCGIGSLASNSVASISLVVTPLAAGVITNITSVSSLNVDTNRVNNLLTNILSVVASAQMSVSPSSFDFGTVATGTTHQTSFVVTNLSGTTLTGTATVSTATFAVTSGSPFSVAGLGSTNVGVSFTPSSAASFTDAVVFVSNGGTSTSAVTGSGAIAPVAGFTASPTNGPVSLGVTFADASTGTITNRSWTFGDGGASTLTNPSHTYTNAGTFSVSLTVFGPLGSSTNTQSNLITVTAAAPVADFTASPTNGAAPLSVTFTDASTGTITNHSWTFGDGGTSASNSPSHTYTNAGLFSVALTVSGPSGSSTTNRVNLITVTNVPPVASFTASPTNGAAPLSVTFTDASTGTITNHSWTFGDGGTSALSSPSHTYTNAGLFSVALTVSGPVGSSTTNRVNLITVTNAVNTPPTVSIVRPATGMLYPSTFTNQTITIVARATVNDGGTISRIEFFVDAVKLGETNANPGAILWNGPTIGAHTLTAVAHDTLGASNTSAAVAVTIGAKNSPLGDWEVTIGGADKGVEFVTFEDDLSASGYDIRLKKFGENDVSGTWGFDAKGRLTGLFIEQLGSATNWTGTFAGTAKSHKSLSGTVTTPSVGVFRWKGVLATTFPDLSGTWTGVVTIAKVPTSVSYAIRTNANDSAVFDVTTSINTNTVIGQLIATSRDVVYGYVTVGGTNITMSGKFKDRSAKALPGIMTFKGGVTNTPAAKIKISIQLSELP